MGLTGRPNFRVVVSAPTSVPDPSIQTQIDNAKADYDATLAALKPNLQKVSDLIAQAEAAQAAGDMALKKSLALQAKDQYTDNVAQQKVLEDKLRVYENLKKKANEPPPENDISRLIRTRLKSIEVTDDAGFSSDTVEITIADEDSNSRIEFPSTGAELQVWLGYENNLQRMGLYIADEIEVSGWPGEMVIRGRAAPYETSNGGKSDLQTQKTRAWAKGTKLGDMVAKIAKEHGLQPAVAASLKTITLPQLDQTDESDVSFLLRVTRKYDAMVKPGSGKLVVAKRGESKTVGGSDMPTVKLSASDCSRWNMNKSVRDADGTVVAFWHDRGSAKRKSVQVGSGDPVRRLRHNFPDQATATKAAQGELDKRERRRNKITLTMPGNPSLVAEARLQISGFRQGVPTDWLITRVTHHFQPGGYSCDVEAEQVKSKQEAVAPVVKQPSLAELQAEFESVKVAWSAENAKAISKTKEAMALREQANATTDPTQQANLLAQAQAKIDESKAIQQAAKQQYEPKYDDLKAKIDAYPGCCAGLMLGAQ